MSDAEVEAEIERLLAEKNAEAKAKHSSQANVQEEEPDYSNMSDAEVEAEIERLLAEKNAQAVAKRASAESQSTQETPIAAPAAPVAVSTPARTT